MRIVVTGATGNVGTSVLKALAGEEAVDEIVGLARRRPDIAMPKTSWVQADVVDDDLASIFDGADAVIHLAWLIQPSRDEKKMHATNVDGSARVFHAAGSAGVGTLVYASSIGAYSPGPKDRPVDESWPTGGIESSYYSRQKSETERLLDRFELEHPDRRVVRLRPGLIFKADAASGIRRLFAGPFLPNRLLRRDWIGVLPVTNRLVVQAVHADDVADAYRRAALDPGARGAYNIAAEPVLDPARLGRALGARPVRVPAAALRRAADLSWRLRLQPTPASWLDMGLGVPVMDTTRVRTELGWRERHSSEQALLELLEGMRRGDDFATPPLARSTGGPLRLREIATGVGARIGLKS